MATETQTDFSGGLNTRLPAHMIGANQATELQNVDLSFGDLRGEYGTSAGGEQEFFYEAGESWVSPTGFSGAALIVDWPYGLTYSGSNSVTLASSINYFSGSPNALIKDGVTITINDGVSVVIYERTQGVHGANSYVEYNDDLYISRGTFNITGTVTSSSPGLKVVTAGTDTYKLQIGDELSHEDITAGTYITEIDTSSSQVTLSTAANAAITAETIAVNAIVSKYIDGTITTSYRAGVNIPAPIWDFGQKTAYNTGRDGSHSETWYNETDPIPFQYGLAAYDSTGVESTMSDLSDSNLGVIGGENFPDAGIDFPLYINVADVLRDTSTKTARGRYALYRVGGSSAIIKRLDNLYFDEHMAVTTDEVTLTNGDANYGLSVILDDAEKSYQFKVKWYCYNTSAGASYRYYNATSGYINPYDASPPAPNSSSPAPIRSDSGETEFLSPDSNGDLTITLDGSSAAHHVDLFVVMKIPGETVEREYVVRTMTNADADVTNAVTYDYIDFQRADSLVDIQPIEEDTTPKKNIEGLVESSNLFYAFLGNRLHISDYGNPNSWPASGFIDFDQDITGLGTLGSELVVFTEYGMYRVFGSDPSLLKKVEIQTTEGIKAGAGKTVTRFQSGLLFAGHNGICFYNGQSVQRMTQNNLDTFALPNTVANSNNTGGYFEDTYFLLGTSGTGYKIDMKRNSMLTRTTMNAKTLFFRGSDNTLYADTGKVAYATGDRQQFTVKTRQFVGGDVNVEKVFNSISLSGTSFTGTVKAFVDGIETDSFSLTSVSDLDRTLYLANPRQGNGIQVQLLDCAGEIDKVSVNYDGSTGLIKSLFNSVTIKYTGTPTVAIDLDGTNNISATTLTAPPTGFIGVGKLYFSAMSTGIVPHLRETNNEASGRVLEFAFDATPV